MTKTPTVASATLVIAPTAYGSPKLLTSDPLTGNRISHFIPRPIRACTWDGADSSAGINGMQEQDAGRFSLDLMARKWM